MLRTIIIILLLAAVHGLGWAAEQPTAEKAAEPVKHGRERVEPKTALKPVKANIPAEYKELVAAFNSYWNAVKVKNFDEMYKYESAAFKKEYPFEKYKSDLPAKEEKMKIALMKAEALRVKKVSEKEVVVEGMLSYKSAVSENIRSIRDRWINEEGNWKHIPDVKEVIAADKKAAAPKK